MPRLSALLLLMAVAVATSACVVEPAPGPLHERWCIDHPYRCR